MEKPLQSFDVCIVCALPEEARAFLEVLQPQCEGILEERVSPRYQYSYRFATLKNHKDELLTLHVSWLPRYGPQEMALHLSHVLEECQPRIAILTGICAGDSQRVQLGDLVVAERTFTYDNGKFTLDEHGRSVHEHDTMTYQLDANILQFLRLFDDWKPLVDGLERPPPETSLKQREIRSHIKAMASGNAVRADHPFEDVQAPVRGTVAIDMEGAAFGQVTNRHPLTLWLVVKGVSDYADRDKNDLYHDYAARASALYALSFIRAYVTNERLPRRDALPSEGRARPSGVWNVPHKRNPHFTGREELLDRLDQQLAPTGQADPMTTRRAALTQPQAIKGLGGIGKTQIAVEYAYRSREQKHYIHTLWVDAASEEAIMASFVTLAELLPGFPAKDKADHRKLVAAIKRWLEQCKQCWLLIFDNADDISLLHEYLPSWGNGGILLTTRANAVGSLAVSLEVEKMDLMEGTQLLLHRALRQNALYEESKEATNVVIALDGFPLALDQAGAYIEETGCDFSTYLPLYQGHRKALLARRGIQATRYPDSVATTWSLSFQKVEQANPAAAELLRLCAFLSPYYITEELLKNSAAHWPSLLQQVHADHFVFNQMLEELLKFSLVKRLAGNHIISIHPLVQAVLQDSLSEQEHERWVRCVIAALKTAFPDTEYATKSQCEYLLPHVLTCAAHIETWTNTSEDLASLLFRAAGYLYDRTQYTKAELLYRRVLSIWEQTQVSNDPKIASVLNNLALLYNDQGQYEQAESLFKRALFIWMETLGTLHPQIATLCSNLAFLYFKQGNDEQAESFFNGALSICEWTLGSEDPQTNSLLGNLASFYKGKGEYRRAEMLYRRALSIWEHIQSPFHPHMANALHGLAILCLEEKNYGEAEVLFQRVLQVWGQALEPEHPFVLSSLYGLTILHLEQGRYKQAESLCQQALHILEQNLGAEYSSYLAESLQGVAASQKSQGKFLETASFYQDAPSRLHATLIVLSRIKEAMLLNVAQLEPVEIGEEGSTNQQESQT